MKTSEYIVNIINKLPKGFVFTCNDFTSEINNKEAVIKALNRLSNSGKITKVGKGKFYKPKDTVFGKLQPNQNQIVKDLLQENGKTIGYLTGYSVYNQLGISTQVSAVIQIGKNEIRPSFNRENYRILFVKQKNTITKANIPLLQLLDAIKYIKKIPDGNADFVCKRFLEIINNFSGKDKATMVNLAMKYPPASRAILGAILEQLNENELIKPLKKSLNPISKYKLSTEKVLTTAENWNII
jgi:hypothetical protein